MRVSIQLTPMLALVLRRRAAAINVDVDDLIEEALRHYLIGSRSVTLPIILTPQSNERVIQF